MPRDIERNEIVQQVIDTIRTDILSNKDFIRQILDGNPSKGIPAFQLTKKNISPNLILELMQQFSPNQQVRQPVDNSPREIAEVKKGQKIAAKPLVVEPGGMASHIIADLLEGNNVYLQGKAGTGKTYLAEAICQSALNLPWYEINCSQWTSPITIVGGQTIKGYQEGLLIMAWAMGGTLILDELPKLDPNTAGLLNAALAKTADQPKYREDGSIDETTIPTIVNGRGESIRKGQGLTDPSPFWEAERKKWMAQGADVDPKNAFRFAVIGTGNTNMLDIGNKYGGNNRQDYSLVDRFAGSFYELEQNLSTEMRLIYPYVFDICQAMRTFLNEKDAVQSISLRTMLNFNRTYEQEMLSELQSPFADKIFDNLGNQVPAKQLEQSVESFLGMMEKNMAKELRAYPAFREAYRPENKDLEAFIIDFSVKYRLNPETGDAISTEEIDNFRKSQEKMKAERQKKRR